MLLVRQLADSQGVGRLGFVNPMLYALAASDQGPSLFHDVTHGGNLQFAAGPGWDYATGSGSPDVTALAAAIVTYLRDHPKSHWQRGFDRPLPDAPGSLTADSRPPPRLRATFKHGR